MVHLLNWVDVLYVILLIIKGYKGFKRGFWPEFFSFLYYYILIAVIIALIGKHLSYIITIIPPVAGGAALFAALLILGTFVFFAGRVIDLIFFRIIFKTEPAGLVSGCIGAALGVLRGSIVAFLLMHILGASPIKYAERSVREKSYFAPLLNRYFLAAYQTTFNAIGEDGAAMTGPLRFK